MTAFLLLLIAIQSSTDPSQLVSQLGSPRFAEREAAGAALRNLGRQAVAALRVGMGSTDAEVVTRATDLLEQIESRMLLEPTVVRLDFRDRPIAEILRELGAQTKWTMAITPEAGPLLSQRKLTLESREPVPFWEAFERIARTLPCQATSGFNPGAFGPNAAAQPSLLLIPTKPGTVPTSISGPFRTSVFKIHHERNREFFAGLPAQMAFNQGFAGAIAQPQPPRAVDGRQAPTQEVAGEFQEQFVVGLQILAEPRLSVTQNGALKIHAAVDDLGRPLSVVDGAAGMQSGIGMNPYGVVGGSQLIVPVSLGLPEGHGKVIKRLKGELPVLLHSRKENPFVLKLADAKGKMLDGPGLAILVHDIKTGPNQPFISIDLTVKVKGEAEGSPAQNGFGPEFGIFRNNAGQSQSQIEFTDAEGRQYTQWYMFNPQSTNEGLRITVRLIPTEGLGPPALMRHYSMSRAESKIEFELSDIPMP